MLEITNKSLATTPMKFQLMARFVNLANSDDEEDSSTNEDSDCW